MRKGAYTAVLLGLALSIAGHRACAQAIQDPASLARAAEAFVRGQIPPASRKSARIRAAHIDNRLRLASCAVPLAARWSAGAAPAARTSVVVSCERGARWRVNVPVTIRSEIEVLVLKAPAARGQSVSAADLARRPLEVDGLAHFYVRSIEELAGRHLARPAPAGVPLPTNWFAADDLVKRGQSVTIVAVADGIRIRAAGRALASGAAEERVRVQNLSSLKVVEGVVESSSIVRVTP